MVVGGHDGGGGGGGGGRCGGGLRLSTLVYLADILIVCCRPLKSAILPLIDNIKIGKLLRLLT